MRYLIAFLVLSSLGCADDPAPETTAAPPAPEAVELSEAEQVEAERKQKAATLVQKAVRLESQVGQLRNEVIPDLRAAGASAAEIAKHEAEAHKFELDAKKKRKKAADLANPLIAVSEEDDEDSDESKEADEQDK